MSFRLLQDSQSRSGCDMPGRKASSRRRPSQPTPCRQHLRRLVSRVISPCYDPVHDPERPRWGCEIREIVDSSARIAARWPAILRSMSFRTFTAWTISRRSGIVQGLIFEITTRPSASRTVPQSSRTRGSFTAPPPLEGRAQTPTRGGRSAPPSQAPLSVDEAEMGRHGAAPLDHAGAVVTGLDHVDDRRAVTRQGLTLGDARG